MGKKAIDSRLFLANVRSSASFGNNVVGTLRQGDPVESTGPQVGDRWIPCTAKIDGKSQAVFVSKNVLRERFTDSREKLIRENVAQWFRFDRGRGKEHRSPYYRFVGEFWQSLNLNYNGKDRDIPWSAAYISFCVRTAGGYSGFKYASAHAKYVNQAIRRKLDGVTGPFWGYRLSERRPQPGDIVCRGRTSRRITYDYAATHDEFKSHCDVVVRVAKDHVVTIGGNVSHSVHKTTYPLNSAGYLSGESNLFSLMKNNR